MFCHVQAVVQTEGVVVVFQCFRPVCGKQAMETNFHTQQLFHAKYKAVYLRRVVMPTNSGGFDLN